MGLFRSLYGMVVTELTSADISGTITSLSRRGILLFDVRIIDELTAELYIRRCDYRSIRDIVSSRGGRVRLLHRRGLFWNLKRLLHRPVLCIGMMVLVTLAIFLPGRVLFVQVEGNERIPANQILEAAEFCGIGLGASRREVRSERVKNALLSAVPELGWAGVNTRGCVAIVTVREREVSEREESLPPVCSIVAARDGIVRSVTVTNGNGLCSPGRAVRAGDTLISGFTDCGLCITATRAEGEIMAGTRRSLQVITPAEAVIRGAQRDSTINYTLIVGKKRINFFKGSGIYGSTCVKMYKEYCLTMPGGFRLPVTLVQETCIRNNTSGEVVPEETIAPLLRGFADRYLDQQMVAGSMTDRMETITPEEGVWCMRGEYACEEMIGRVRTEQIGEYHEAN